MTQITSDSSETNALLERLIEGDDEALAILLDRHEVMIAKVARRRLDRRVRKRLSPSDVVQETKLDAVQRIDEYLQRRPMPFRLWLLKTAHERLLKMHREHIKTAKRSVEREIPLPDRSSRALARRLVAGDMNPSDQLKQREQAKRLRQVMAQLSETDREVIMLRNFDELSNREVALLLQINEEAAKKRYARALIRLQRLLPNQS
jgi:RNA polymerase sigma-70 factor (ECF subfamily)